MEGASKGASGIHPAPRDRKRPRARFGHSAAHGLPKRAYQFGSNFPEGGFWSAMREACPVYYNTAFHQGAWFQTTIERPFMYASDDEDGFLPLQEVGVTINGQIPSGKLGLNYVAEIGNGRGRLLGSEPAQ